MFSVRIRTSWLTEPTPLQLFDIQEVVHPYPLIERSFFDDMASLCRKTTKYQVEMGLLQLLNPKNQELNPDFWILLLARDNEKRDFQLLIERTPDQHGRGVFAAVGPLTFFEFVSKFHSNMIKPTLNLLMIPDKVEFLTVVVSRPATYSEKTKDNSQLQAMARFQNWISQLKSTPNERGEWFPGNQFPVCPRCHSAMVGLQDAKNPTMGNLICPQCGYIEKRPIFRQKPPF